MEIVWYISGHLHYGLSPRATVISEKDFMRHRLLMMPLLFFGSCIGAYAAAPHVHGTARMQLAIEGKSMEVALTAPLDSLLGFEHAPRNDSQRKAVREMMARLNDSATLLIPSAAAQCKGEKPLITAPALETKDKPHRHGKHHDAHDHAKHEDEHAEIEAVFSFYCTSPAALRGMEVRLFDAFPRLQRLQAEVAAPGKQSAASLTRELRTLSW